MSSTEQIADEAAQWIVENQNDPAPAVLQQLGHWLIQSGDHVRAYLRVSRIWVTADLTQPIRPADELINVVRAKLCAADLVRSAEHATQRITPSHDAG